MKRKYDISPEAFKEAPNKQISRSCCELRFDLYDEDYKVDKDSTDKNCPLKDLERNIY